MSPILPGRVATWYRGRRPDPDLSIGMHIACDECELTRTLAELTNAARSVRGFADYLEHHPDALITGK